ncbi:MAG: hypothetical protein KDB00_28455, partial [Planctomycetales bacterium]|nr:hypothetical protein [Planctomycetales bacterium]
GDGGQSVTFSDGTFDAGSSGGAINLTDNTITFADNHGLQSGDTIRYDRKGGQLIGGLTEAPASPFDVGSSSLLSTRRYGVLKQSDTVLSLGAIVRSESGDETLVDRQRDEIRFAAQHFLESGDQVIYQNDGGSPIADSGGALSGTYTVEKIDGTTIKLLPAGSALASKDFSGANINDGNFISLSGHGFVDGTHVMYKTPDAVGFTVANVDVKLNGSSLDPEDNQKVVFKTPHNLNGGDHVIYTAERRNEIQRIDFAPIVGGSATTFDIEISFTGGSQIVRDIPLPIDPELILPEIEDALDQFPGVGTGNYAVTKVGAYSFEVEFLGSLAGSDVPKMNVSHNGSAGTVVVTEVRNGTGDPIEELVVGQEYVVIKTGPTELQLAAIATPTQPINLTANTNLSDIALNLRKVGNVGIPGLVDGQTYYVDVDATDPSRFQLFESWDGQNFADLVVLPTAAAAAPLTGISRLKSGFVDITSGGSGKHTLTIDLTGFGSGTQKLEGVGGLRAFAGAPSGDWIPTASATGSGGGGIRVSGATTRAQSEPTVMVNVGGTLATDPRVLISAHDVNINANAVAHVSASSANGGGGLVAVGRADSQIVVNAVGEVHLDNTDVFAANSLTVQSDTVSGGKVLSDTDGGGLVDIADAGARATIRYSSLVDIGTGSTLVSDGTLTLDSASTIDVDASALADSRGLGASGRANAPIFIGNWNGSTATSPATTRTQIGQDVSIRGNNVQLNAAMPTIQSLSKATVTAGGLGAVTDANATSNINSLVEVKLMPGASVLGQTVVIDSGIGTNLAQGQKGVDLVSVADADCSCGFGRSDAEAGIDYQTETLVTADDGARVSANDLDVSSRQAVATYSRSSRARFAGLGGESAEDTGNLAADRGIVWNADVALLAGLGTGDTRSPYLEVDAGGNAVGGSNIPFSLNANDQIVVDPIGGQNADPGTADFFVNYKTSIGATGPMVPDGTITGSGGVFAGKSALNKVEILSYYPGDLVIQSIDVVVDAKPVVKVNSENSAGFQFLVDNSVPPGSVVDIKHDADVGDILLLGGMTGENAINNPLGSTKI